MIIPFQWTFQLLHQVLSFPLPALLCIPKNNCILSLHPQRTTKRQHGLLPLHTTQRMSSNVIAFNAKWNSLQSTIHAAPSWAWGEQKALPRWSLVYLYATTVHMALTRNWHVSETSRAFQRHTIEEWSLSNGHSQRVLRFTWYGQKYTSIATFIITWKRRE